MPRLWRSESVEYALEVVDVTVLWRLGPKALEAAENEDAVEAIEFCRNGYSE
jgi:hypothetical protein